ncbi:hypothetical protein LXL04_011206 [Taraxacum kok-saghyz]
MARENSTANGVTLPDAEKPVRELIESDTCNTRKVQLTVTKSWINGSHAPIISESVPSSRHPEGQSRTHRGSREKFHHTGASCEGFTTSIDHLLGTSTPSWVIKTRCITLSRRFEHWTSQRETSDLAS